MNYLNLINKSFRVKKSYNEDYIAFTFHPLVCANGEVDYTYKVFSLSTYDTSFGSNFLNVLSSLL